MTTSQAAFSVGCVPSNARYVQLPRGPGLVECDARLGLPGTV